MQNQKSKVKKPALSISKGKTESLASIYFKQTETEKLYQLYTREFSQLNDQNLKFYFEAARKGINFFKAFLFEEIRRRDLRIGGLCQTRKLSVLADQFELTGEDENLKAFVEENFASVKIKQFISDIIEAQIQGMSVFQLFYNIKNNRYYLNDIILVPNYLIYYKDVYSKGDGINFIDFTRINSFDLRAQANVERPQLPLVEIDPVYYYTVYSFDGNEENGLLNGLIDGLIYGYFAKVYGLKDWAVFLERFAIPAVIGKYDPLMSKPDRDALWNAVNNFGNLFRALIPNTAELDSISDNNKGTTGNLFEQYADYWNNELAIRVLGEASTTQTTDIGSFAKAKVGKEISEDISLADKALVEQAVNGLIKKIVDINFDNVKDYPVFRYKDQENIDHKNKVAEMLLKLKQAGFELDEKEASEIFKLTLKQSVAPLAPAFAEPNPKKKKAIEELLLELWSTAN
jgi:phage gp29-like protein